MANTIVRVNDNGENQIESIGRIERDDEGNDCAINFKCPLFGTPLSFRCELPYEGEDTSNVEVRNDRGDQVKSIVARVKKDGKMLGFYFNVLFWTMFILVPMPDDGKINPKTGERVRSLYVPVYLKEAKPRAERSSQRDVNNGSQRDVCRDAARG